MPYFTENIINSVHQADAPNDIPELFLPDPNAFVPTDLNVDKRQVTEVPFFDGSNVQHG